jgi:hypothetical protein
MAGRWPRGHSSSPPPAPTGGTHDNSGQPRKETAANAASQSASRLQHPGLLQRAHWGPARGLRDGVELFKAAEKLGYQSGWAYQRHFDQYLSSPIPFFAAVGQHTGRITLGSAVIPMRYQDPILLAEAAGTADLLTEGWLQLAFSSGTDIWDAVFGAVHADARTEGQRRLAPASPDRRSTPSPSRRGPAARRSAPS